MAKVLRRFNSDLVVCEMQFGYKETVIIGKIRGGRKRRDVRRIHLVANTDCHVAARLLKITVPVFSKSSHDLYGVHFMT